MFQTSGTWMVLPFFVIGKLAFVATARDKFTNQWEEEFIEMVSHQYVGYDENSALIIKSKLYYWTEEDKINLCYNLSQEMDPDAENVEFKNTEQPAMIEKTMTFRGKNLAKKSYSFWYLEAVRCPIRKNTFYVYESVRRNCYFILTADMLTKNIIHINEEYCVVDVLNSVL